MRLPGLTSLVLELPWAEGTATASAPSARVAETPGGSILPHRTLRKAPAGEHSQPWCFRAGADPGLPQQGGAVPSRHVPCCPFFPAATAKNFPWAEQQA